MEEVIENEPWKIDDEDLWDAFAECKPSPFIKEPTGEYVRVKQNEIEVIKYNVDHAPYTGYPGYLQLMWIREWKFGRLPLRKKEAPAFFRNVSDLDGVGMNIQSIRYELNGLEYRGCFKSNEGSYILTKAEAKKAKEWFDNLVLKAEHSKEVTVPSSPVSDSVPDDPPLLLMAPSASIPIDTLTWEEAEILEGDGSAGRGLPFALSSVSPGVPGSSPKTPFYICTVNQNGETIEHTKQQENWIGADEAIRLFGGKTKKSTFYNRVKSGLITKRDTDTGTYYLESSVLECKRTNP